MAQAYRETHTEVHRNTDVHSHTLTLTHLNTHTHRSGVALSGQIRVIHKQMNPKQMCYHGGAVHKVLQGHTGSHGAFKHTHMKPGSNITQSDLITEGCDYQFNAPSSFHLKI